MKDKVELKLAPNLADAFIRVIDTRTGAELPFTRLRGDRVLIPAELAKFAAVQEATRRASVSERPCVRSSDRAPKPRR